MLGGFYGWGAGTGALRRVYRASWLWLLWVFDFTAPNYIYISLNQHAPLVLHPTCPDIPGTLTPRQWPVGLHKFSSRQYLERLPHSVYTLCIKFLSSIIPSLQEPCPNGACRDPRLAFSPVLLLQVARLFWTNLATMGAACVLESGLLQIRVIQLKPWAFN